MKRIWFSSVASAAAFLMVVGAGSVGRAQTVFDLGFTGPDSLTGNKGSTQSGDYRCTLTSSGGGAGAQGWSISMTCEGGSITAIDIVGTAAEQAQNGGFEKSELTSGAGNEGAVSAIVLHFTKPVTLPADATSDIAKIGVSAVIPDAPGTATLRYVDGRKGSGQPVANNITQEGATRIPNLGTKPIALLPEVNCAGERLNVGFSSARVASAAEFEGILGDNSKGGASGGEIVTNSPLGATGQATAFANIVSHSAGAGAQGWSLAIGIGGEAKLTDATVNGTAAEVALAGGFEKTELTTGPGNEGAVSAIVLHFTKPVTLPATGTESVLKLTAESAAPQGEARQTGVLTFKDGLVGAGQPVQNAITVGGGTESACNFGTASVNLQFDGVRAFPFVRGNANNDAKVNIADPIWIINELFRSGDASVCQDAADANNDGTVDAADAVYLIEYQFSAGAAPPAPFPACGLDPEGDDDGVTCEQAQGLCNP